MENIKIHIMNHSLYPLPSYATSGSAGADLCADIKEPLMIFSREIVLVPTGISIALPMGYEAQIRSRSGMTLKHGIVVANGIGTIDSDYRGEIKVIIHNISDRDYLMQPGEKIAQMVIAQHCRADFIESVTLEETDRGEGGFGHSGK